MAMSAVANWQGVVLANGLSLLSSSKEVDTLSKVQRAAPQCKLTAKKRVKRISPQHGLCQSRIFHFHVVHQPSIVRWPSPSLSSSLGGSGGNLRWEKHGLDFSGSAGSYGRTHGFKLLASNHGPADCRVASEDDEEAKGRCDGFVSVDFDDEGRRSFEFQENGVGEEMGRTNPEDVSLGNDMQITDGEFDDAITETAMQLDGPRKLLSSIVRTLSGASIRERESIIPHEKETSKGLAWNPLRLLYETDPSPAAPWRKKFADGWRRAEADFFAFSRQLGKYVFIMSGTGAILVTGLELGGGSPHEQGVLGFSWLAGVVIGSMIGAGQVLKEHAMAGRRNVIITGSTRGLGKALAREFLRHGDNVVVTSRSADSVDSTVEELREELQKQSGGLCTSDARMELFGLPSPKREAPKVVGIACDVSKSEDVRALADYAVQEFGTVDLWINNAGVNKGFRPLLEFSGEEIEQIVSTNLTGSMICTREAIRLMDTQKKGGHIFNMDGAGSGGSSTPLTAAYGATKCGLRQLTASLLQEVKGSSIGIHTASPGMVLTDLLLSGASLQNKKMFNFICEQPETVARALVPNLRLVNGTGKAVNYLTPARIVFAIVSLWIRRGRWFDEEGRAVYAAETERLRLWAEGRERSPVTAAMELVPSGTWVSILSSSVICAYLILTSAASNGNLPGI